MSNAEQFNEYIDLLVSEVEASPLGREFALTLPVEEKLAELAAALGFAEPPVTRESQQKNGDGWERCPDFDFVKAVCDGKLKKPVRFVTLVNDPLEPVRVSWWTEYTPVVKDGKYGVRKVVASELLDNAQPSRAHALRIFRRWKVAAKSGPPKPTEGDAVIESTIQERLSKNKAAKLNDLVKGLGNRDRARLLVHKVRGTKPRSRRR